MRYTRLTLYIWLHNYYLYCSLILFVCCARLCSSIVCGDVFGFSLHVIALIKCFRIAVMITKETIMISEGVCLNSVSSAIIA